jgi:hypothetical protein
MNKAIALLLAVALAGSGSTALAENRPFPAGSIVGPGNRTCADWELARMNSKAAGMLTWAQGYISAANVMIAVQSHVDPIKLPDVKALAASIDTLCDDKDKRIAPLYSVLLEVVKDGYRAKQGK